jgi:hypothetical protein
MHWIQSAFRVAEVRLRLPIVLVAVALVIGQWDALRNRWERITRPLIEEDTFKQPVSSTTEYFCPMDPGVVSSGPGRCGVCNMALVRRRRGDAVMLPDGVVARMQLSPYRIQLAGIRTAPAGYLPLHREVSATGLVTREGERLAVVAEMASSQAAWLQDGRPAEVVCRDLPESGPLAGRICSLVRTVDEGREITRVTVAIESPPKSLGVGAIATIRCRIDAASLEPFRSLPSDPPARKPREPRRIYVCHAHPETIGLEAGRCPIDGRARMAQSMGDLERVGWWCPMHPEVVADRPGTACEHCGGMVLQPRLIYHAPRGQVLAVPQSAVVDAGERRIVFVEGMSGMFDGVEVALGPRCGDFYPVIRGVDPGQRVVVAGTFLLDAETRLNPALAAGYFGASRGRRTSAAMDAPPTNARDEARASEDDGLAPEDRALADRQKTCPVTGKALGAMGTPDRQVVGGRVVFLCCAGCRSKLLAEPAKYLVKVPAP